MTTHFETGHVIFRQWDKHTGLHEVAQTFSSIEELFNLCLQTDDRLLVDRIVMDGCDSDGVERFVTLAFQSTTIRHREDE